MADVPVTVVVRLGHLDGQLEIASPSSVQHSSPNQVFLFQSAKMDQLSVASATLDLKFHRHDQPDGDGHVVLDCKLSGLIFISMETSELVNLFRSLIIEKLAKSKLIDILCLLSGHAVVCVDLAIVPSVGR
jgi:hypothetical protein